jgi:hypothetical protein
MGANLSECFFRFVKISRVGYKSSMGLGAGLALKENIKGRG